MSKTDLPGLCVILVSLAAFLALPSRAAEKTGADRLYDQALELANGGDNQGALKLFDQVLKLDKKYYPANIERGYVYLRLRARKEARLDFEKALNSKSNVIRARAYVGLGDVLYDNPTRTRLAIEQYRMACRVDPNNREALYSIIQAGFKYEQTIGHRVAGESLAQLVCLDPEYRGAYRLWRDRILDKSEDELRQVDQCLEEYLTRKPDSLAWWVDIANDRFRLGQTESALETLARLKSVNPGFSSPELYLTEAVCRLEKGDSAAFQQSYWKALDSARETGDFSRLISEAETIFTPGDNAGWTECKDNASKAAFLRTFWSRINPDQLSPVNARLVEHYNRLCYAGHHYRLLNPHSPVQSNQESNLLLAYQGGQYQYDSEIFLGRSRNLALDQRGLLYLRLGEPDKQDHEITLKNPIEVWYYGGAFFVFEKPPRVADYIFRPVAADHAGNMMKAMETQRFVDRSIHRAEEYYFAQFLAEDGSSVDLEFYQDERLQSGAPRPGADAALYDTLWTEIERKDSRVYRVPGKEDNLWLAVHSLSVPPGPYFYILRLKDERERWISRGRIGLQPFGQDHLNFSAVLLGIDPPPGSESYQRREVRLVPRPSMKFSRGEQIKVFFELYGLKPDLEGRRSYGEWVDVIRLEQDGGKISQLTGKLTGLFTRGKEKIATSITHIFERNPESTEGPVAETFVLDSSVLEPGRYRLLIEARDNANAEWGQESAVFEVTR